VPSPGLPEIALGSTRVEVTLVEDDGDTVLTLRHHDIPAALAADHGVGWAQHLAALVEVFAT
jgi:hypothetical protein